MEGDCRQLARFPVLTVCVLHRWLFSPHTHTHAWLYFLIVFEMLHPISKQIAKLCPQMVDTSYSCCCCYGSWNELVYDSKYADRHTNTPSYCNSKSQATHTSKNKNNYNNNKYKCIDVNPSRLSAAAAVDVDGDAHVDAGVVCYWEKLFRQCLRFWFRTEKWSVANARS